MKSVSVVPVGLTRHRQGLYPLRPVHGRRRPKGWWTRWRPSRPSAWRRKGSRIFWCSDEFYLQAGRALPEDDFYEEYTQLENGVGMLRLLETESEGCRDDGAGGDPPRGPLFHRHRGGSGPFPAEKSLTERRQNAILS